MEDEEVTTKMDCLNLNQLLQASSKEAPSGVDLEYDPIFGEMERASKGKEERQLGDDLIAAEEPDWSKLKLHALAVLERSKDLRAGVQLTRALLHTDGYTGLASGLELIRGYVEDYWDTLFPQLDPDDSEDPTIRINTLLNLCDPFDFILPISKLPIINSPRMGSVSYRDIQIAKGAIPLQNTEQSHYLPEQIEAAVRDVLALDMRDTHAAIKQSAETAKDLAESVCRKLGPDSVFDLQPLISLLAAAEKEAARGIKPMSVDQNSDLVDAEAVSANQVLSTELRNREDVIRCLDQVCFYYAEREPSSPVPLLLKRARDLVMMDFKEIVRDLAPDSQPHFGFLWRQDDG